LTICQIGEVLCNLMRGALASGWYAAKKSSILRGERSWC